MTVLNLKSFQAKSLILICLILRDTYTFGIKYIAEGIAFESYLAGFHFTKLLQCNLFAAGEIAISQISVVIFGNIQIEGVTT